MRKIITAFILIIFLLQNVFYLIVPKVGAVDLDGSARLDLSLSLSLPQNNIVGRNFSLGMNIGNALSSEEDAFNPGFIVRVPSLINFVTSPGLGSPKRTLDLLDGTKLLFFKKMISYQKERVKILLSHLLQILISIFLHCKI